MHSNISSVWPALLPKTWFISVSIASQCKPAPLATLTKELDKSLAISIVLLKDPLPTFTSSTKDERPLAIFFERIDDVIKGKDSTVPTISLIEYNFLSAGAKLEVWPIIAQPTSFTTFLKVSKSGFVLYPGIESNLSRVPPVWPKPLPEIIGTYSPQAASIGANITLVLSPTPPVECLSQTRSESRISDQFNVSPEFVIASVKQTVSSGVIPFENIAMLIAAICASEKDPFVKPSTKKLISSFDSSWLSLFFLIISWGIIELNFLYKLFN